MLKFTHCVAILVVMSFTAYAQTEGSPQEIVRYLQFCKYQTKLAGRSNDPPVQGDLYFDRSSGTFSAIRDGMQFLVNTRQATIEIFELENRNVFTRDFFESSGVGYRGIRSILKDNGREGYLFCYYML